MRKRANSAAAIASASSGMAMYSEFARSFSAKSEPAFRDPAPIRPREAPVATGASDMRLSVSAGILGRRAPLPLEEVVHLVEERVQIVVGLVDHDLAFVVLERADIDWLFRLQPFDRRERCRFRRFGRAGAKRCVLNEIDLVAASGEVRQRFPLGEVGGIALVDRDPLVLGAGD